MEAIDPTTGEIYVDRSIPNLPLGREADENPYAVFIRTPYNYDRDAASAASGITFDPEEGMAHESFKDECDINNIVKQFGLTGELPDNYRAPQYGDFTGIGDYQTAMNAIREADEAFMQMPADLRARFDNDPQKLIEFLEKADNKDEAKKLGLLREPEVVPRDAVMAIDELRGVLTPAPEKK